jgi:hypothetical protein
MSMMHTFSCCPLQSGRADGVVQQCGKGKEARVAAHLVQGSSKHGVSGWRVACVCVKERGREWERELLKEQWFSWF